MSANNKKFKLQEYLDLKQFLNDNKDKLNTQVIESINSVLKLHDNFFQNLTESEVSYLMKKNSEFKSNSEEIKNQIINTKKQAKLVKYNIERILKGTKKSKEDIDNAITAIENRKNLNDELDVINKKLSNKGLSSKEKNDLESLKTKIEIKIDKNEKALEGFDETKLKVYAKLAEKTKKTIEENDKIENKFSSTMETTNEAIQNRAKGINAINTALKDMGGVLMGYVKNGFEKWKEIDEKVYTVGRHIGLSSKELRGYQINVMNNYDEMAAKLGMTFDELFKFQENYTKSTGRAIVLTNNQVESLGAVSKLVGDVATNEMVKNMDDFGASTQTATSYLAVNMARAKSQGLDAQKASEAFANNVKLASKYTFREGINGISKMTLLSQKLKFNMDSIANAAEKFETVEGAIGTSANLQMLGGSYSAQFGNPLEAMNMAMLDMEGFTNKIVDTFSGKATFNRETGQVEMSAIDKRLMKEAAKQLGISYDEAWNMASQQAKNADIERDLSRNTQGFTEDEKAFITSKTQFIDGKHQMVYYDEKGNERKVDVENLTRAQLEEIRNQKDVEHAIQGDVHGIHNLLNEYLKGETLNKMSWNEQRKGNNESIAINFADIHDEYMGPVKNLHKNVINEDNRWVLASIIGALTGGITTAIPMLFSQMMPNFGETIGKKIFDTFGGLGRRTTSGGTTSTSGFGGKIKNGAKAVWGGIKKYGGKALRGIGSVASKIPGWGKAIGIGAALIGGGMALMSNTDGSEVDKSKLGRREVEPINNKKENETSTVNQQSQELIELQKQTVLLQAMASKQGVNLSKVYENSTVNKTDIENKSEQTTASSVLSDTMNTTLMTAQLGKSKIAASGFKAVAGKSGLKIAANMGRMAKAANPLGWISLGSGVLKDLSGVEKGSGVDKAWSTANAMLDGASMGAMIGSIIPGIGTAIGAGVGTLVGGAIGVIDNYGEDIAKATKSVVDGVSGFFFGSDNMSEADKAQQSYEETKMGIVDITDPQLEQKAYYATCKIHDIVVSMWHHMNGKQSNGLEEDKGLIGSFGDNVSNVTNNIGGTLVNTITTPFKLIGSLFGLNDKEETTNNVNKNVAYSSYDYSLNNDSNISQINKNGLYKEKLYSINTNGYSTSNVEIGGNPIKIYNNKEYDLTNPQERYEYEKLLNKPINNSKDKGIINNKLQFLNYVYDNKNPNVVNSSLKETSIKEQYSNNLYDNVNYTNLNDVYSTPNSNMSYAYTNGYQYNNTSDITSNPYTLTNSVYAKDVQYNNTSDITSKPTVGETTYIRPTVDLQSPSYQNGFNSNNKIDLNVSGSIKLTSDRGGSMDIDMNKLLNNTEFMNNLITIISENFNKRVNGQRQNKNSIVHLQNGGYGVHQFDQSTAGWA